MAQVSNEGNTKKLEPLSVPKIIEQLERALNDIKYRQTDESDFTINEIDNVLIDTKKSSDSKFIGKELMLFEMIGVLNGKITDLQKKYNKLKNFEERQEEFASEKADKITDPIEEIIDYAKLSKSGQMKNTEALDNILNSANKLQNNTTVILDTNRIVNNSLKLFKKKQNINEIILECINSVKIQSKKIQINVGLDQDIIIPIDKFRLTQVIKTIMNNAVRYTEIGYVKIESFVVHVQNLFILRIFHTGKEIPKEKLQSIFERGRIDNQIRADGTSKLSLFLCKGIIEAHGGNIIVKNNLDHGCTFTITLPIK